MIKCSNCQTENEEGRGKYCSHCGSRLPEPSDMDRKANALKRDSHRLYAEREITSNQPEPLKHYHQLMNDRPPSFQAYPGLTLTTMILFILGLALMFGGGI